MYEKIQRKFDIPQCWLNTTSIRLNPLTNPIFQVWPSQDSPRQSPRGEGDGQSFIFPPERRASSSLDCPSPKSPMSPRTPYKLAPPALHPLHALHVPSSHDQHVLHDSGIDSVQVGIRCIFTEWFFSNFIFFYTFVWFLLCVFVEFCRFYATNSNLYKSNLFSWFS